jgi:hypothetical protein
VDWSATGGGSVSPASGSGTTFTASKSPSSPVVHAKKEGAELTVNFNVIPPSSITVIGLTNSPPGTETANGTVVGARTIFTDIFGPTNVSFLNAEVRESIPPLTVTWPNGTNEIIHVVATTDPINIPCGGSIPDTIMSMNTPMSYLFNGTNYVDFSYTSTWTDQYKDDSGNWVDFYTLTATYEFRASDKKCRITYLGTSGSWQGPY